MQVFLPAEAGLDLYKAAYIIYIKESLRYCNFQFIYPNKRFFLNKHDILLGINIQVKEDTKTFFNLEEVFKYYGEPEEFKFLYTIPNNTLYGFRNDDKTAVLINVFEFFANYIKSAYEFLNINDIIDKKVKEVRVGDYKIGVQRGAFITVYERLLLFKQNFDYCIFFSGETAGIQKTLIKNVPLLTRIKLPTNVDWFVHSRGHLVMSKSPVDFKYVDVLSECLTKYLEKHK